MSTAHEASAPESASADPAPAPAPIPSPPSFLENLLSPRGIHAILGSGGGLFVIGIITWLATLGIFDHPLVLASALGAGNLVLLGLGYWLVLGTRYQLAGLALTLLACLVMPLHLWFYHAQKLLTFDNHLWAAALVISLLYALTARVLRNIWFVPIFLGGIALTTLLILADLGQFWQITAPAISLCVLGLIAIHAERLFTEDAGSPFRRGRFGLAFFWSGHALLGLGLMMVLVAQLAGGPLYATYTKTIYDQWNVTRTDLVTTQQGKLIALFLVLAGVYAHLYSDMIVRRKGYYLQIAALLLVWIEFIIIDLLNINLRIETLLGIIAGTGLLLQLLDHFVGHLLPKQMPVFPFLGSLLSVGALAAGLFYYFTDGVQFFNRNLGVQHTSMGQFVIESRPILLISMVIAGIAQGVGCFTSRMPYQRLYQGGLSLAALLIPALALSIYGPQSWFDQAGLIMVLSIVAIIVAWRRPLMHDLGRFAHLLVAYWLILGSPHLFYLASPDNWSILGILLAASIFYFTAAQLLHHGAAVVMGILCIVLGLLHIFAWFDFALAYKMGLCAVMGAVLIVFSKVSNRVASMEHLSRMLGFVGQFLFFIAVLSTMLLGVQTLISHTPGGPSIWPVFNTLVLEAVLAGLFYALWKKEPIANAYLACAIANVALAGILLVTILHLPMWRKLELASIGLGLGMTFLGFRAWFQELGENKKEPTVSPLLLLGSLLIGIPIAMVVMSYRMEGKFMVMDEGSMLIIGLVLLGAGCLFQLRIPAIAGAALTMLYLAGLLLFVPWKELGTAALILAFGGAGLFILGLALSIFRDRLLALPMQVKERRGIFQVLGWR